MPPTLAARWMTTPAPSTAARVAAGSRRSCSRARTVRTSAPSRSRSRVTALPKKPAPPVTTTALPAQNSGAGSAMALAEPHGAARQLILEQLDVGVDHDPHELLEGHGRLPAEPLARLRRVPAERVDLGGPEVARVDLDVLLPVDPEVRAGLVEELGHRV